MRKGLLVGLVCLLALTPSASAECPLSLPGPVLITSLGQNLDGLIVRTMLADLDIEAEFQPLARGSELNGFKQLIVSPGVSFKGLAAAGLTFEEEVARGEALIAAAEECRCELILVYLGGFMQGDARSQQLVELLAPHAQAMIIYKECRGALEYLRQIADEKDVPLFIIDDLGSLREELRCIFSG